MKDEAVIEKIEWVAVDWGTTHLRVFAMDADGKELAALSSEKGMGKLQNYEYEAVLRELISPWTGLKTLKIICCGMVGARQGWIEAPYQSLPCHLPLKALVSAPVDGSDMQVFIVPGLKQEKPADVMRGEETQIAGFLSRHKDFDGVICLPGSHTKWVQAAGNKISSFRTVMTGELFAAISAHTVLKHSVACEGFEEGAFQLAFDKVFKEPACVSTMLFSLRAQHLFNEIDMITARSMLSGILLGAEIASIKELLAVKPVVIIGAERLSDVYQLALRKTGVKSCIYDAGDMTKAGLYAAYQRLEVCS